MITNYKYEIDQKVITPFGKIGIISMLGFNEAKNLYYVKSESSSSWFKEKDLEEYNLELYNMPDETITPPLVEY